jgi:hypothetical protein
VIGATLGISVAVLLRKMVIALLGKSAVSIGISYSIFLVGTILLLSANHRKVESLVSSILVEKQVSPTAQQDV